MKIFILFIIGVPVSILYKGLAVYLIWNHFIVDLPFKVEPITYKIAVLSGLIISLLFYKDTSKDYENLTITDIIIKLLSNFITYTILLGVAFLTKFLFL